MSASIEKLCMPKWGLSMTEGRLLEWLVDEGAEITPGQEVAEVETNKLTGAVECPVAGVLRRRVAAAGEIIPVGGLLGVLADGTVGDEQIDAFVAEFQDSFVPEAGEEAAGPSAETVELAAGRVRFLRQGEGGSQVVLLHGFGGDLENWLFTASALAERRTVHALDLPGHGGSTKQVGDGSLDGLLAAVEQFLERQGIERVHLIGHSLGGLLACKLALDHPERVRSLALIDSAGLGEEINTAYIEQFVCAGSRRELKAALQLLFADPGQVTRQLLDDVLSYKRIDGVPEALAAIASHLLADGRQREVLAPRLASLQAPMLVIWGAEDRIIPVKHARRAPSHAEVHILSGAGHSPHLEASGEVNRLLGAFLEAADAG